MSGLRIHVSNRLEILADLLAGLVQQPPLSAFAPEVIVVQSRGMERWISLQLAQRHGISANIAFPFPNAFIQLLFRHWLPKVPETSAFEPGVLAFRIMQILSGRLDRPDFSPLKRYLESGDVSLKLYQLCTRIADTFDQYLVFRPDMIFEWEHGQPEIADAYRWQVALWKALVADGQHRHRAFLQKKLLETINTAATAPEGIPARVAVFGISYLPPAHLQILAALSRHVAVHLFLLNPCREYWADIVSEKERVKHYRERISDRISPYDLHLESGNALLGSMGRQGRDFFSVVAAFDCEVVERFEDPPPRNRLCAIQSDILNLRDRPAPAATDLLRLNGVFSSQSGNNNPPLAQTDAGDESIQVHSCHSPQREIEILHDQLLAMFDADPGLQPQEIVVMMPDIETYAPYIHAVFDTQFDQEMRIPYRIADRTPKNESRLIESFMTLLDIQGSRFGASAVLGLLDTPVIRERFGISERDLEKIEQWISDLNIRWGRDANQLTRLGLPQYVENTWRSGIERLLLGIALPDDGQNLFARIRPYGNVAGTELQLLGNLLEFLECLFVWSDRLEQKRSLLQWRDELLALMAAFFQVDPQHEWDFQLIRSALAELGRMESAAGFDLPVGLDIARAHIEKHLVQPRYGYGFMTGGVTFCAMLPMRSIPFKVVCMIGMDNAAFPRDPRPLGFDLVRRLPRPGDRSQRNDDRYLFLEALLSARHKLYLSYVGQGIQDNTSIPPSVLVSELVDYLAQGFGADQKDIVVTHPLQGFSQRYFDGDDPRLFSYARENYAAVVESAPLQIPPTFLREAIPTQAQEGRGIDLRQLCRFYRHPTRYLLQHCLGLQLQEPSPAPADRESFNLDGLDRHRIGQELLEYRQDRAGSDDLLPVFRAEGRLPQGRVGEVLYRAMEKQVAAFIQSFQPLVRGRVAANLEVDLTAGAAHFVGRLAGLYPQGLVSARFARERAKDLLDAWIRHLILCVCAEKGRSTAAPVTYLVTLEAVRKFARVENPLDCLVVLLDIYRQGLRGPLPFFPETALVYVTHLVSRGKSESRSLQVARKHWFGDDFRRGESQDPYYEMMFSRNDPIDARFATLAKTVFEPLLEYSHVIEILR